MHLKQFICTDLNLYQLDVITLPLCKIEALLLMNEANYRLLCSHHSPTQFIWLAY